MSKAPLMKKWDERTILPKWKAPQHFNFVFSEHNFAFLAQPKCATTTFRKLLRAGPKVPRSKALEMETRFAIIRHPLDRILSAHRYGWSEVPFEAWWEFVKTNPEWDVHTYRYSINLGDDATDIVRLEDILDWYPKYHERFPGLFPARLQHHNKSSDTPQEYEPYIDDILTVYADDLEMWNRNATI